MRKGVLGFAGYLLVATLLIGCAAGPGVSVPRFREAVTIDGTPYIYVQSLVRIYDLNYHFDPFAKKITLIKNGKKAVMMAESSSVLLNDSVRTMEREARVYQGSVIIPRSFARGTLAPFFKKEYRRRKPARRGVGPIKNVIIDAGHGGKEPGAVGRRGLKEKDVVLDIAKRLRRKLKAAGIGVTLTRKSDSTVSLAQRAKIANKNDAEGSYFLSIHANASRSKWVSGVEVFCLSESVDDNSRALKLAKGYRLNLRDDYSGKNTETILRHLMLRDNRRESVELAKVVGKSLSKKLSQRNRGIKQAGFYVLKGTHIPAILVEVGFITNLREEKKLRSASYRDKIAQGIAAGLIKYNRSFSRTRTARY